MKDTLGKVVIATKNINQLRDILSKSPDKTSEVNKAQNKRKNQVQGR